MLTWFQCSFADRPTWISLEMYSLVILHDSCLAVIYILILAHPHTSKAVLLHCEHPRWHCTDFMHPQCRSTRRTRSTRPRSLAWTFKHCLLSYGNALLAGTADIQIKQLQSVQNQYRILRLISVSGIIIITRLMTHVKVIHRVKNRKCGRKYDPGTILLQFYTAHAALKWHFCDSVDVYRCHDLYLLNFKSTEREEKEG